MAKLNFCHEFSADKMAREASKLGPERIRIFDAVKFYSKSITEEGMYLKFHKKPSESGLNYCYLTSKIRLISLNNSY